jgi:hypothetical protein
MELTETKPLLKIETKDWIYYSEWPKEFNNEKYLLAFRTEWNKKQWVQIWDTILPYDPFNTKISVWDIADRYLYFVLPVIEKEHPDIANNLRMTLKWLPRSQREAITYNWLLEWVKQKIKDKEYYK